MCKMIITVKDSYIIVSVKNKRIMCLASPVLKKYTKVNSFDKENGVISLMGQMDFADGSTSNEEDWIDLNDTLGFAFKDPDKIIREIDSVQLV